MSYGKAYDELNVKPGDLIAFDRNDKSFDVYTVLDPTEAFDDSLGNCVGDKDADRYVYYVESNGYRNGRYPFYLRKLDTAKDNQYLKQCQWCQDVKTQSKHIESVNFTFNYCPECGR